MIQKRVGRGGREKMISGRGEECPSAEVQKGFYFEQ